MEPKEEIRKKAFDLGVDDIGFASIDDYKSPRSPDPKKILPGVKSLVVLAYRQTDGGLDTPNMRVAMAARMGMMDCAKEHSYEVTRFIENRFKVRATPILFSYPLNLENPKDGVIGDVSIRHAAVAAGLGTFGMHNLVVHPRFGSRVAFTTILTELPLKSDPPVKERACTDCGMCVDNCPGRALEKIGYTDEMKCLKISQPFGIGGLMGYIRKFIGASPEEQKQLLRDPIFLSLYQASFIGFQYCCFNCISVCPLGQHK